MPTQPMAATQGVERAGDPGGGMPGAQAGGTPGGVVGGQIGGQVGGTLGGQVGGRIPPRFDAAYLQNPSPEYPSLSRRMGEEGRVVLRVLVTPEGRAEQLEIRTSSGFARLDQAALDTVRRWRFAPARQGAESVHAWVLIPVTFSLDS